MVSKIDGIIFIFIYTGVLAFVSMLLFIYPVYLGIKSKYDKKKILLGILGILLSILANMRLGLYAFISEGLYSLIYLYMPLFLGILLIYLAKDYEFWFMEYTSKIYGIFLMAIGIFYLISTYILGY